ncbi:tRNA (adenine(22)-N(1))-methyltransferase [Sulfoacidibacillus thermotolerans]|uniref:SAM-dependent methyltransferase n=1 Tax=Sulfoacidibacillus thermotolerans TaxID=1765684 RepID=A0A2U3D6F0_SULT2|nr:class I SAM-dependent methyltransferase [Sulfoacidibacillus thermotolerans]PWI56857.1 hypothetical protein BM613_11500 [Sulfoacidibacillus thermotolerans]
MHELSLRLQTVADQIGTVECFADIGSDHGLLPIALVRAGRAKRAIAVEVAKGPCAATAQAVLQAKLQESIEVRLGDGLTVLQKEEVDAVVIAGMGGQTMWDILTSKHADQVLVQDHAVRLVLQPMAQAGLMRYFALHGGYEVCQDVRLIDKGIHYEVMCLQPHRTKQRVAMAPRAQRLREAYEQLAPQVKWRFVFGETLLHAKSPQVLLQMQKEARAFKRVLKQAHSGRSERAQGRINKLKSELDALLELMSSVYGVSTF